MKKFKSSQIWMWIMRIIFSWFLTPVVWGEIISSNNLGVNTLSKLKLESKLKKQTNFGDVFKNQYFKQTYLSKQYIKQTKNSCLAYALLTWKNITNLHLDKSYLCNWETKPKLVKKNLLTMKRFGKKSSNNEHMKFTLG